MNIGNHLSKIRRKVVVNNAVLGSHIRILQIALENTRHLLLFGKDIVAFKVGGKHGFYPKTPVAPLKARAAKSQVRCTITAGRLHGQECHEDPFGESMASSLFRCRRWLALVAVGLAAAGWPAAAPGRVLRVGPDQPLRAPSAAAAVAQDGDVVEIEAGEYPRDVAVWSASRLTLRGVHGWAHLAAQGRSAQQKAIWVLRGRDTTVEHIEFYGCRVPDRNGAGIRQEGPGLTVRHCRFHDNEDGILTGASPESDILIEHSEFHHNGQGDGYSHNLYIGRVRKFTLQFCYSHHAHIGHLVKSRAEENRILYNRLTDEQDGRSSYVLDLPNGGRSFVIGNILQHGPRAENGTAVSYAAEGAKNAVQELYFVNNTCVNERQPAANFLRVAGAAPKVRVLNNLFLGHGRLYAGAGESTGTLVASRTTFTDAAQYDYRLAPASPAIGAGTDPGAAGDFSLRPAFYYQHPLGAVPRPPNEKLNVGACPAVR